MHRGDSCVRESSFPLQQLKSALQDLGRLVTPHPDHECDTILLVGSYKKIWPMQMPLDASSCDKMRTEEPHTHHSASYVQETGSAKPSSDMSPSIIMPKPHDY